LEKKQLKRKAERRKQEAGNSRIDLVERNNRGRAQKGQGLYGLPGGALEIRRNNGRIQKPRKGAKGGRKRKRKTLYESL